MKSGGFKQFPASFYQFKPNQKRRRWNPRTRMQSQSKTYIMYQMTYKTFHGHQEWTPFPETLTNTFTLIKKITQITMSTFGIVQAPAMKMMTVLRHNGRCFTLCPLCQLRILARRCQGSSPRSRCTSSSCLCSGCCRAALPPV